MAISKMSNSGILGGNTKYDSMLAGNAPYVPTSYQSIATATGDGSSGVITFNSIPQTFKHLQLRCNMFVANANQTPTIQFNGATGASYTAHYGYAFGTGGSFVKSAQGYASRNFIYLGGIGWGTVTTYPNVVVIDIHDYSATDQWKVVTALAGFANGIANEGEVDMSSGMYTSTSAISSISIQGVSIFTTDTTIALYGIVG